MTVFMKRMRYFKMDREKGITASYSQILDYWDEDSESVIYNKRLVKED